jgi:hypothetical protein
VIAPAISTATESDVTHQARLSSTISGAANADVENRRARLDPVSADHREPPDGGDQDVGPANDGRQVAAFRMRYGDRTVFLE